MAVIFELGRDFSADYEQDWALDLIEILKELATDSNKYRAKKDRKQQRANFRDILRYIEVSIACYTVYAKYLVCFKNKKRKDFMPMQKDIRRLVLSGRHSSGDACEIRQRDFVFRGMVCEDPIQRLLSTVRSWYQYPSCWKSTLARDFPSWQQSSTSISNSENE